MWARTLCPLSSSTLKNAFGSDSTTVPSISMAPSFLGISSALRFRRLQHAASRLPVTRDLRWLSPALRLVLAHAVRIRAALLSASRHARRKRAQPAVHGPEVSLLQTIGQCEPGLGI